MIINNGIISSGDFNTNTINEKIFSKDLENELNILSQYSTEEIKDMILAYEKKDANKFLQLLKSLGRDTINLIKKLGLKTLEMLIEKYIIK